MKRPTVHLTVRALQPLVAGLESLGFPAEPILRASELGPELLDDPDGQIPAAVMATFWEQALAVTGDLALGLHLAEAAPISSFEVHAYALLSSGSLREAYRRACRYQRLIHETTRLSFEEGPESATLSHALPGGRPVARHPAEFLAATWVRIGRLVIGQEWVPQVVDFGHGAPEAVGEHERLFGSPVRFDAGRTAIRIDDATLDQPGTAPDQGLTRILDRHVLAILAGRPDRETLAGRVHAGLVAGLQTGEVKATDVARRLSMSERSLRRGLAAEGTSHREILDGLRLERAMALLSERRCSIGEIGFLLGFSELSAFYRAFKRWTGSTPAEVRARGR